MGELFLSLQVEQGQPQFIAPLQPRLHKAMLRAATSSLGAFEVRQILTTFRTAGHASNSTKYAVACNVPRRPLTTSTSSLSSSAFRIRSQPNTNLTFSSNPRPSSASVLQKICMNTRRHFHKSKSWRDARKKARNAAEADPTTLSGRLKKLIREYGWSVLGVYLFLSAADFPFCYLLVRYLGTDRIGKCKLLPSAFLHESEACVVLASAVNSESSNVFDAFNHVQLLLR